MLKAAIEPVLPARMAVLFGLRGAGPSPPCHYVKGIVGGARGRLHCAALLCTALLCTARPRRVPAAPAGRGRAVRCGAVRSGPGFALWVRGRRKVSRSGPLSFI